MTEAHKTHDSPPHDTPPRRVKNPAPATIYLRPAWRCFIKLYVWAGLGLALMVWSITDPARALVQAFMTGAGDHGHGIAALTENIPWAAHYGTLLSTTMMIGGAVLFLGAIGRATYHHFANRYTITPERVESRHGIIANNKAIVSIIDIRTIDIEQSVTDRLLNVGSLELSTAGTAEIDCILKWIHDPERYHQLIYGRRNQQRKRGADE